MPAWNSTTPNAANARKIWIKTSLGIHSPRRSALYMSGPGAGQSNRASVLQRLGRRSLQRGVERDLGVEHLRHRAVLLGGFRELVEVRFRNPRHLGLERQRGGRNLEALSFRLE